MLSCPSDCCGADSETAARCGDGRCDAWAGENCITCPSDCARVRPAGSRDILPFPVSHMSNATVPFVLRLRYIVLELHDIVGRLLRYADKLLLRSLACPSQIDASGHFQFLSHDMPPSSGLVWWCCGGGELGDGCGEPACAALPDSAKGGSGTSGSKGAGVCRSTCATPHASRRRLQRKVLSGTATVAR